MSSISNSIFNLFLNLIPFLIQAQKINAGIISTFAHIGA